MRYAHPALGAASIDQRQNARPNVLPARRASRLRRLAWKIVYCAFIACVAIYVWWRR